MRTKSELKTLADMAMDEMKKYNLYPYKYIPIELNSRLTRALGRCVYALNPLTGKRMTKKIELQTDFYFSQVDDSAIISTLIHEYLHSIFPYDGHIGDWKKYADLISQTSEYEIKRVNHYDEFIQDKLTKYKYEVFCPVCGKVMRRYKTISGVAAHPQIYCHKGCTGGHLETRVISH